MKRNQNLVNIFITDVFKQLDWLKMNLFDVSIWIPHLLYKTRRELGYKYEC